MLGGVAGRLKILDVAELTGLGKRPLLKVTTGSRAVNHRLTAPGSLLGQASPHIASGTTTSLPTKSLPMKSVWARWKSDSL